MNSLCLLTFIAHFLLTIASAASPPDDLTLLFPDPQVTISLNQNITVGVLWSDENRVEGVLRNASLSFMYPNGTSRHLFSTKAGCVPPSDGVNEGTTTFIHASLLGMYTIFWNVTYNMSSDPSQTNATTGYCGPGPYSLQSWLLNETFQVGTAVPVPITSAVALPSQPTGTIPNTGENMTSARAYTTIVIAALVAALGRSF